ncbi:AAA domain-containing protein [Caenispirillum bisanense]|uniref:AAA domain-containing protein n=1 Tax=Caenispirillum bisanense TaxID=414052 RepID=A0A286GE10_9PROT|nr:AAA domain-containing protein [Caenispirillum bisanense]SOD93254.1 Protein of unknown function [Caenispirillum bisanense]
MTSGSTAAESELDGIVIDVLMGHPTGLRTDQIRTALARRGVMQELSQLTTTLSAMQQAGKVTFKNRQWNTTGPIRNRKPPAAGTDARRGAPETPGSVHRPAERGPQMAPAGGPPVPTMRCHGFTGRLTDVAETAAPQAMHGSLPQGLPLLRKLIPYWRECLRAEERPNTVLPLERIDQEFCALTTAGEWWPTEQRQVEIHFDAASVPPEFLAVLSRRGPDADLYLGYPVQILPGVQGGGAFARPVFTFRCRFELGAGTLRVVAPAQPVDVNAEWLEKQFRDGAERRSVLRWLGITAADPDDDGAPLDDDPVDLPTVTTRLAARLPGGGAAGLAPSALATSLPVETDSPRLLNVLTLFTAPTTVYSKRTLRELDRLAQWPDSDYTASALGALFGMAPAVKPERLPCLSPIPLNEDQTEATAAALNAPLTVVTGPPGTGKSQTVAAVMASAALCGRTALLASKNHKAIDTVEERLGELLGGRSILARASRPFGEGQAFDLRRASDALFARGSATGRRDTLIRSVGRLRTTEDRLYDIQQKLARQEELGHLVAEAEAAVEDCEARLDAALREWARRPDAPAVLQDLSAAQPPRWLARVFPALARWLAARKAKAAVETLAPLGIPWPDHAENPAERLGVLRQLAVYLGALADLDRLKPKIMPESERQALVDALVSGRMELTARAADLFRALPDALEDLDDHDRPGLAEFAGAMSLFAGDKLGDDGEREHRRATEAALPILLKHFPLWAVTNLSAGRALPLQAGLFDYVIIDEASQCDIASALPLLARARQAIIVGDPAQLRHVTKVTQDREVRLLEAGGLLAQGIGRYSYRSQSLFNIVASIPGITSHLLRDHYRCAGAVAAYFNDAFYGGRLRVVTDEANLNPPHGQKPGIHWTGIGGDIAPAASGCHSPAEARAIVEHVRRVLVDQGYQGSIGIVTAFREQAKRITDLIAEAIPAEHVARSRLGAFTAHQFQGDARDLILLSLCLGPGMPQGSRSFLAESANLMNVAVSRARAVCHVFGNLEEARRSGIPHVTKLVAAAERETSARSEGAPVFESPWEEIVHDALMKRGVATLPQFPIAGRRLDLAIICGTTKVDVEIDGDRYHRDASGRRKSSDLWRDHQLKSLGWRVKRYWVYQLREDLDGCLDDIIATLRR